MTYFKFNSNNLKKGLIRKLIFFVTMASVWGCRKECRQVSLPKEKAGKDYTVEYDYKYQGLTNEPLGVTTNKLFFINDDSTYHSLFPTKKLGEIDFSSSTVIGACTVTNPGTAMNSQAFLAKKKGEDKWKYVVQYSIQGQCKGSGISSLYVSAWVVGPKLPGNAEIELEITDVNPF